MIRIQSLLTSFILIFGFMSAGAQAPVAPPNDKSQLSASDLSGIGGSSSSSVDTYTYDPTGKRDPFRPEDEKEVIVDGSSGAVVKRGGGPAPLEPRELEPLESFDVSQLKLSAIIWDVKTPRALVQDPSGGSHIIRLKTRLGKKNGFVAAIREGEVVVVEYDADVDQWVKSFKVLELR